tara:strand:+ start:3697 stop:4347 length:651 start_codon:yes stop_codon:yes gene_type:complete
MKNPIEMLKEIKNLLGVELTKEDLNSSKIILAQLSLKNGTILESENFENGNEIFILTEDQQVPLPIGNYELEDGRILKIKEEGLIESIEVEAGYPSKKEDDMEDDEKKMNEELYPTREEFDSLKEMVESMKKMIEPNDEVVEEEEMSNDGSKSVKSEKSTNETVYAEKESIKNELSKPAVNPIKHNPEKKSKRKVLHSQKRGTTTLDIVMNKILNK